MELKDKFAELLKGVPISEAIRALAEIVDDRANEISDYRDRSVLANVAHKLNVVAMWAPPPSAINKPPCIEHLEQDGIARFFDSDDVGDHWTLPGGKMLTRYAESGDWKVYSCDASFQSFAGDVDKVARRIRETVK